MEINGVSKFQEFSADRLTKRVIYQKDGSVIFVLNFKPGQELPPHKHPGTQVYVYVLQGGGTVIADEQQSKVSAGDVIHCHGDELFSYKNTSESDTSLLVTLNKIPDARYAQDV